MRRRDLLGSLGAVALAGTAGAAGGYPAEDHPDAATTSTPPGASSGFAPLGSLPVAGAREAVVGPDGTTVYVAAMDGFVVVDVADPAEPRVHAERRGLLPGAEGGPLRQVQEVAVDGDRLLVMGPAHPNRDALNAAVLFDVSDPAGPRRLAVHRTDYPIHNGDLADGVAYLTASDGESGPLAVVAMAGESAPDGPRELTRWSVVDEDDAWADVPVRLRPMHDVFVRDGIAYCSVWDAGTWLVDVRDPSAPAAIGHVGNRSPATLAAVDDADRENSELPGNHHSAAIGGGGDLLAIGHEAFDADGDGEGAPGGIDLVDVSTPDAPAVLATIGAPPTPDPAFAGVRTTAHNFELRDGVLYSAWFRGGLRIHDVSDPSNPREVATWRDSATASFWTGQLADDAVVASSVGTDDAGAGLYTFPRPSGGSTSPARAGGAASGRPTGPSTTAGGAVTASPGVAGFGVGTATLVGGLGWLLARRRRD